MNNTEQLEAFKKHMEAGETNTSAIIMGEENEDDTENGQQQPFTITLKSISVLPNDSLSPAAEGEKDAEDKDVNSEAPSSPSEATSEKDANSVSQSNAVSSKEEERSNSVKKVSVYSSRPQGGVGVRVLERIGHVDIFPTFACCNLFFLLYFEISCVAFCLERVTTFN